MDALHVGENVAFDVDDFGLARLRLKCAHDTGRTGLVQSEYRERVGVPALDQCVHRVVMHLCKAPGLSVSPLRPS